MKRYRNKLSILATILRLAQTGNVTKTRLMYGAYISYEQMSVYMTYLLADELLMKDERTNNYSLTTKGASFIHTYQDLVKMAPSVVGET